MLTAELTRWIKAPEQLDQMKGQQQILMATKNIFHVNRSHCPLAVTITITTSIIITYTAVEVSRRLKK